MGNNEEEACNTGLELGFGLYSSTQTKEDDDHDQKKNMIKKNKPLILFDLLPKENRQGSKGYLKPIINTDHEEKRKHCIESNNNKVNYDFFVDNDDDDGDDSHKHGGRKKLKLTKDQATLLEDYFKLNTTLDPASKQALADRLNLKPRQVSVWFQNRRARTKLKKTEEDYQSLKKCCENLSHENRRLKKELQELRLLKIEPLSNELRTPANKLIKCLSCEKIS